MRGGVAQVAERLQQEEDEDGYIVLGASVPQVEQDQGFQTASATTDDASDVGLTEGGEQDDDEMEADDFAALMTSSDDEEQSPQQEQLQVGEHEHEPQPEVIHLEARTALEAAEREDGGQQPDQERSPVPLSRSPLSDNASMSGKSLRNNFNWLRFTGVSTHIFRPPRLDHISVRQSRVSGPRS
eukprot:COSAG05_NODE_2873_length_2554_cov_1.866802_4_plen_184_part_00